MCYIIVTARATAHYMKGFENMKEYRVTYKNEKGETRVKIFNDKAWAHSFMKLLDGKNINYVYSH